MYHSYHNINKNVSAPTRPNLNNSLNQQYRIAYYLFWPLIQLDIYFLRFFKDGLGRGTMRLETLIELELIHSSFSSLSSSIRQTVPCRAIRGNSISVNSISYKQYKQT